MLFTSQTVPDNKFYRTYIFDIDGTLTPPRQKINHEFGLFLKSIKKRIILITGSDIKKVFEQGVLDYIGQCELYTCSGNEHYKVINNRCTCFQKNKIDYDQSLMSYLIMQLQDYHSKAPPALKQTKCFDYRSGLLNFSLLGRSANQITRDEYEEYDGSVMDRERIVDYINNNLKDYHATIGGQISIDIVKRNLGKEQITKALTFDCLFFGDKISNYGNDYLLSKRMDEYGIGDSVSVNSYHDTWSALRRLCGTA